MANSTPSSVLNELAKCNKVTAQYVVAKESGPAHNKQYKVDLQIGGCGPCYEGTGSSLKAARNAAAFKALNTPTPASGLHINPTVELNILSMKSAETASYRELDSVSMQPPRTDYNSLFTTHQTFHTGQLQHRHPASARNRRLWRMSVTICGRTYIGEGTCKSEARGNAATHALSELKGHLHQRSKILENERKMQEAAVLQVSGISPETAAIKPPSAVSKVYEVANRNRMSISFDTVNEAGPPHVKNFFIKCKVGQTEVLGQGVGKKAAKNDAAEKMLIQLKETPTVKTETSSNGVARAPSSNQQRSRSNGRSNQQKHRTEAGLDPKLDPVTYLTQLMQLRNEHAPVYKDIKDNGPQPKQVAIGYNSAGNRTDANRIRYEKEVSIDTFTERGCGENKKKAKAEAANNLLKALGINLEELKKEKEDEQESKRNGISPAAFLSNALGALHKQQTIAPQQKLTGTLNRAPGSPLTVNNKFSEQTCQELNTGECKIMTHKKRMEHAADREKLQVIYNDFKQPNENGKVYTCQLAVLCQNPVVFKGTGQDIESAREDASTQSLDYFTKQ